MTESLPHPGAVPSVDGTDPSPEVLETVVARLRADNEGLRTSLRHRAVIEQAKGVLMARTGCSPARAFERLVEHSQHTNQKLVRVAAAVVGATVTAPTPVAASDAFELARLLAPSQDGEGTEVARADRRLAGVALEAALDLEELVRIVAFEAAADLGPAAALLAAMEPDGALRLVAGAGYDRQMMSAWQRIPPAMDVPLVEAARRHTPVLLRDSATRVARFPPSEQIPRAFEAQASIPLQVGDRTVGVIGMSWREPREFSAADETRLREIADQTVGPFLRLLSGDEEELPQVAVEVMGTRWFRAALDTVLVPLFLLSPIRDEAGAVVDFEVLFVNHQALAAADPAAADRIVGRTVLALYPRTAGGGLFRVFCKVLETGATAHFDRLAAGELVDGSPIDAEITLSVARVGDSLLVNWRRLDG